MNTSHGRNEVLERVSSGAQHVLDRIASAQERGERALVPDIVAGLQRTESSVTRQLEILAREGLVSLSRGGQGRGRFAELTNLGKRVMNIGLPEVGVISGGDLIYETALDGMDGEPRWIERLQDVIPYQPGDYCLRVVGDSMSGHGIWDGSRVFFHPLEWGQCVSEGTLVHVEIDYDDGRHQVTLKEWFCDTSEGVAILKPASPYHSKIIVPLENVVVRGWAYHFERALPGGVRNSSYYQHQVRVTA